MQLISSTDDFVINGMSYSGIPLLVDSEMQIVEPVLGFIVKRCIERGGVGSYKTIRSYAKALYDYFSFLEANDLDWVPSKRKQKYAVSVIAQYRDWSASLSGSNSLKRSTINVRLSVIKSFYEFCLDAQLVDCLPWQPVLKQAFHDAGSFLGHTKARSKQDSSALMFKTFNSPPKILTVDQVEELLKVDTTETLKMMIKLALAAGLRRDEILSFQRSSVFEPSAQQLTKRIPIDLYPQPGGQRTKGSRARTVYVPGPLLRELYDYAVWSEGADRVKKATEADSKYMFLTNAGKEFSENGFNTLLSKLTHSGKISFKVTPHSLRHTYATLELYAESRTKDIAQALAWVRDRLGHSSITTTMVYLHCMDHVAEKAIHQYQKELMEL